MPQTSPCSGKKGEMLRGDVRRLCGVIVETILPPGECLICGADRSSGPAPGLCRGCWRDRRKLQPPLCARCGAPIPNQQSCGERPICEGCLSSPPPFRAFASMYIYAGPVRRLLLIYKDQRRYSLAPILGQAVWRLVKKAWPDESFEAVIPVPSPFRRLLARGFGPADLIAKEVSSRLGIPCKRALEMRKSPLPQKGLTAAQRRANIRAAFKIAKGQTIGKRLLLVDDITTTGATIREAARVLSASGAEVFAATVAMAVKRELDMAEADFTQ